MNLLKVYKHRVKEAFEKEEITVAVFGMAKMRLSIMNDAKEFKSLNLQALANKLRKKIIIDGRGIVNKKFAEKLGFIYMGVGRV